MQKYNLIGQYSTLTHSNILHIASSSPNSNDILLLARIYKAHVTTTENMYEQHKQSRQELQDRHQEMTNKINEYTNCM